MEITVDTKLIFFIENENDNTRSAEFLSWRELHEKYADDYHTVADFTAWIDRYRVKIADDIRVTHLRGAEEFPKRAAELGITLSFMTMHVKSPKDCAILIRALMRATFQRANKEPMYVEIYAGYSMLTAGPSISDIKFDEYTMSLDRIAAFHQIIRDINAYCEKFEADRRK